MQTKQAFKDIASHYTALSDHYDDWFSQPWPQPAVKQGEALHRLMKAEGLPARSRVLDLTCGIGTQAIGLAMHGHDVTGLDISEGQLKHARERAGDLRIDWILGNAAFPEASVQGPFDLILSFGNSLPLLGDVEDIRRCLSEARNLLAPGGLLLLSMRDHTDLRQSKPYVTCSGVLKNQERQGVWLETAEWLPDGKRYNSHIIFILTAPSHEEKHYPFPPVAALTQKETLDLLEQAGYSGLEFRPQADNPAFSFPIYKGIRPA